MEKMRILFVDDEVHVIEGLRRMLRKQRNEWDMVFASSGTEALATMEAAPFDVIVTDMQMPGMNGAEVLERVLQTHPDMARIVLSGHADEATTSRALKVAHQFVSKPADPEALKAAVARACAVQQLVENDRIRGLVAKCETLPSLPTLYVEITKAAESETTDARQIAQIISRDMAMSAKILQLVNSSFFGIARRISSIEQTVTLLGLMRIKALVLSENIFRQMAVTRKFQDFDATMLWKRAYLVGEVARLITQAEQQGGDRSDQAFTAGLLHDIGILVLMSQHGEAFERVLAEVRTSGRQLPVVEREQLGATHGEIGAYLLGLWGLPPRIVEAVILHHTPGDIPYEGVCAVTVVHVADALVDETLGASSNKAGVSFASILDTAYLERVGVTSRLGQWRQIAANVCAKSEGGTS